MKNWGKGIQQMICCICKDLWETLDLKSYHQEVLRDDLDEETEDHLFFVHSPLLGVGQNISN